MDTKFNKPYKQIWSTLFLIFIFSILVHDRIVDIQLHDTYFVFPLLHLGMLLCILLGIIGGVYWLLRGQQLIGWITKLHVITTIFLSVLLLFLGFFFKQIITLDFGFFYNFSNTFLFVIFLLVVVQFLLIINLIIALINKIF